MLSLAQPRIHRAKQKIRASGHIIQYVTEALTFFKTSAPKHSPAHNCSPDTGNLPAVGSSQASLTESFAYTMQTAKLQNALL